MSNVAIRGNTLYDIGADGILTVMPALRVRYNISYNDGLPSLAHGVFRFDYGNGKLPAGPDSADINNNLIYTSSTATINAFYANTSAVEGTAYFYNNIFYVPAGGALQFRDFTPCDQGGVCFGSNVYSGSLVGGSVPPDATAANRFVPMFVNPAPPGTGRSSTAGLKLRAGSPALRLHRDRHRPQLLSHTGDRGWPDLRAAARRPRLRTLPSWGRCGGLLLRRAATACR